MDNYKVIDNFLDKKDFLKIKNQMEAFNFPYYLNKKINPSHDEEDLSCYFTHVLFSPVTVENQFFNVFKPLIEKLNCKKLIRVKCNLYLRTSKIEFHEPHADFNFEHKGALFSLNTNDGGTILNENEKIDSVENRILFFDPSKKHNSTSTTNAKFRMNININYL